LAVESEIKYLLEENGSCRNDVKIICPLGFVGNEIESIVNK
jgi:hypothetical protein